MSPLCYLLSKAGTTSKTGGLWFLFKNFSPIPAGSLPSGVTSSSLRTQITSPVTSKSFSLSGRNILNCTLSPTLRGLLFSILLFALMLPPQILYIPQFRMLVRYGLVNTRWALILLYAASGLPGRLKNLTSWQDL